MTRHSFWQHFTHGQQYMDIWPMRKELMPIFPEYRYIKATKFAIRVMPAVAVISILSQMTFAHYSSMPQAMAVALFALSMPLQGLWWLGKRSRKVLPVSLASWYREIHDKISAEGHALPPVKKTPRYKELAEVLNRAFKQLDSSALERWF